MQYIIIACKDEVMRDLICGTIARLVFYCIKNKHQTLAGCEHIKGVFYEGGVVGTMLIMQKLVLAYHKKTEYITYNNAAK